MASTHTEDHERVHYGTAHPAKPGTHAPELADDDPRIWGWHSDGSGKGMRKAGIGVIVILLLMLFGNHRGKVEDIWLVAVALILLAFTLISTNARRKSAWRK